MTTYGLDTILKDLQTELKTAVLKVTPSERGSERFIPYNTDVHGAIAEATSRPRLFWVEPDLNTLSNTWIGTDLRRYSIDWNVTIGYPPHGWEICAASDSDDLRGAINAGGGYSTTTGCAFRVVKGTDGLKASRDDNWLWATTVVQSVMETTNTAKVLADQKTKTETAVTVAGSPVTLYSFTPTSDGAASWSYHVLSSDGKTSRGGLLSASWDVATNAAVHWDESTSDIVASGATYANTLGLVFNAAMSAGVVYLKATSTTDTWTVRTTELARSEET